MRKQHVIVSRNHMRHWLKPEAMRVGKWSSVDPRKLRKMQIKWIDPTVLNRKRTLQLHRSSRKFKSLYAYMRHHINRDQTP